MTAPIVVDSARAFLGLHIQPQPDQGLYFARHRINGDRRATGLWQVVISPDSAVGQALGLKHWMSRPAVVDDFGSLVCVGEPQ